MGNFAGELGSHLCDVSSWACVFAFRRFHRLDSFKNQVNAEFTMMCTKMQGSTEMGNRLTGSGYRSGDGFS
jgi:hypothetical protein